MLDSSYMARVYFNIISGRVKAIGSCTTWRKYIDERRSLVAWGLLLFLKIW
jgi:hypothetical protein